ncbi:hypothetical protein J5N97_005359 [Dioscorea zingiberensis]|uniref:Uncharacterized protein n=1 Tax=Dioscorea zingiberensis TaxID=325984 RepID=A0A9D5HS45_9LILI|nr:hypothetical protein J5N97_005359 [Dioscorea zingiberensis]
MASSSPSLVMILILASILLISSKYVQAWHSNEPFVNSGGYPRDEHRRGYPVYVDSQKYGGRPPMHGGGFYSDDHAFRDGRTMKVVNMQGDDSYNGGCYQNHQMPTKRTSLSTQVTTMTTEATTTRVVVADTEITITTTRIKMVAKGTTLDH